jgi:hypothetical protein
VRAGREVGDISLNYRNFNGELQKLGFRDQTGGWGGSTGIDYVYKKSNTSFEKRTVDFDTYRHSSSKIRVNFKSIEELNQFSIDYFEVVKSVG